MTKKFFLPVCLLACFLFLTGFSTHFAKQDTKSVSVKPPCNISVTFYNYSTTYTIPWVALSDSFTDDTDSNIAPSGSTVLTISYAGGSLEFNVQFSGKHPAGRVKLFKNGSEIACTLIAASANVVTLQMDNSPSCTDTYELKFEQITTC